MLDAQLRPHLTARVLDRLKHHFARGVEVVRVDHLHVVRAEVGLGRRPEDALDRGADVDERTVAVEHDDDVGGVLDERAHAPLAAHHGLARVLLLLRGPSEHPHGERQPERAEGRQPVHPRGGDERWRDVGGDGELPQGDAGERAHENDPPGAGADVADDVVHEEHVADRQHRPPAGRVHHDRDERRLGRDADQGAGVGGAGATPDGHELGEEVPAAEQHDQLERRQRVDQVPPAEAPEGGRGDHGGHVPGPRPRTRHHVPAARRGCQHHPPRIGALRPAV